MIGLFSVAYAAQATACKIQVVNDVNPKQSIWLILNRDNHKKLKNMKQITQKILSQNKAITISSDKSSKVFMPVASKEHVRNVTMPSSKKFYLYSKDKNGNITYHLSVLQKWCAKKAKPTVFKMTTLINEHISGQFVVKFNRAGIHERIHSRFKNLKQSFSRWGQKVFGK